jgi:FAD synthetase
MAKAIVFGTFDILHEGHLNLFRQAKKHADFLIAVVGRDGNVEAIKGKKPRNSQSSRLLAVYNAEEVDLAVLGGKDDPYKVIEEQKPDVICLGYDQNSYAEKLDDELGKRGIKAKIVRLEPYMPEKYKSSKIANSHIL